MDHKTEQASHQEVNSHGSGTQKKGGVLNTLYPPGPKPGAKGRLKNHCVKFWWCDLLVFAIIVLIIILPVIYVAFPNRAQSDLNESTLDLVSQEVTSPEPDGIHLRLVGRARSFSDFHPTIDGFRAGLSLEGKEPFIYVNVPETKADAETDIVIDQDVEFASMERFIEYNKMVMGSESFNVYFDGDTTIHQSGLPGYDVTYHKQVNVQGLNKLKGLNISDIQILSGDDEILEDGSNMIGTINIPNPSVMVLELGNVTMNLKVDDEDIGTSLLPDLVLRPGDNNVPMQSTVDQLAVISLIRSKYSDGVLPFTILGNSSTINGTHLEYFEAALQSNTINLDLDVGPALQDIGINITSFS